MNRWGRMLALIRNIFVPMPFPTLCDRSAGLQERLAPDTLSVQN
jgi:hypothetical protein